MKHLYGGDNDLIQNVFTTVTQHPPVQSITRRSLQQTEEHALERSLRKAWSHLRRAYREIENQQSFDKESNAWIPIQAYYAGYYSIIALSIASKRIVPKNHRKALNIISQEIQHGRLPYPWSAYCIGCPQNKTTDFGGIKSNKHPHVLSLPNPDTSMDRLAMFLTTTRKKELERRFQEERLRNIKPGSARRNLSRKEKENISNNLSATTMFDLFWRIRIKTNYGDPDTFVLGATGKPDAYKFGSSLVTIINATVTAIEVLISSYIGMGMLEGFIKQYELKTRNQINTPIHQRRRNFE